MFHLLLAWPEGSDERSISSRHARNHVMARSLEAAAVQARRHAFTSA
jgi:hypothetical protein